MDNRNVMAGWRSAWLAAALLLFALPVAAQTTTGTIRGTVRTTDGAPLPDVELKVTNVATGFERSAVSRADGSYTLPGLPAATYNLVARKLGHAASGRQVAVLVGATQIIDLSLEVRAVEVDEVVVTAAAPVAETRTSEVATNVTREQIERLPTPSRNFLDLAVLAPGVTVQEDRANGTGFRSFSAGGQGAAAVNVFIDGTSLKNDLTGGGVSGQDASRGNPFPRNAIQEYRVLTQNFKAEYQKASSAVITATTKSGGNEWSGSVNFGYQNRGLVALDSFQRRDKAGNPNFEKPDYSRYLVGGSVGGPLIRNKLHVFGSYEGNYQNRASRVAIPAPPAGFPALDSIDFNAYNGNFESPFRETLLFGKLTYAVNPNSTAEFSLSNRHETDVRDFGDRRVRDNAVNFRNKVTVGQLRYNMFSGPWLNETKLDFSRFRRNPSADRPGIPTRTYAVPGGDVILGSLVSTQDFIQKRIGLRNDLTYTGWNWGGQHVLKAGVNVDFVNYDITKVNGDSPNFRYVEAQDGQVYNYEHPRELIYGRGSRGIDKNNTQIGLYLQDDWSPTERLTFNLGIRWDVETNMYNTDYRTPQNVIDTLTRYNDSLPVPLNLDRYITDGNDRKPFYGAFQPRVGLSYALDSENKTTVFAGFGIYYDRSLFDLSVDETLKLAQPTYSIRFAPPGAVPGPGEIAWDDAYLTASKEELDALVASTGVPEAWLFDNKAKVPKSRQWNVGVRRVFGDFVTTLSYNGVRSVDNFVLNFGNSGLNANGSCCISFNTGAHGFANFIYSTSDVKTWYDALTVQVDRPYRRSRSGTWGWGAGISLTYAERSVEGVDNLGDLFAFPNTRGINKHAALDEKARVVANWITDVPYLFGIQYSGLITLGSGARQDAGCPRRFCSDPDDYLPGGMEPPGQNFLIFGKWVYRNVDMKLRKDFPNFGGSTLGVTVEAFNVFNFDNFGCFNTNPGAEFKNAGCVVTDGRRVQLGAEYNF
jgi:outer membrane receptor protein involved in Fe transport